MFHPVLSSMHQWCLNLFIMCIFNYICTIWLTKMLFLNISTKVVIMIVIYQLAFFNLSELSLLSKSFSLFFFFFPLLLRAHLTHKQKWLLSCNGNTPSCLTYWQVGYYLVLLKFGMYGVLCSSQIVFWLACFSLLL